MCGIAGWIDYENDIGDGERVALDMSQTLRPRGPDEDGLYGRRHVWLIHRRLAVMDPEHGKQPMRLSHDGDTYSMVYNGEHWRLFIAEREGRGKRRRLYHSQGAPIWGAEKSACEPTLL